VSCGRSNATEQKSGGDEPDGVDTEVVDNLRAALDVERSMAQQLTESLQHEQERVAQLTAELTRLSEQFAAECSLAVHSRNNVDSSTVSSLLNILLHSSMFMILSFHLDLRHFIHRFLISVSLTTGNLVWYCQSTKAKVTLWSVDLIEGLNCWNML